jgi:REP element-mobilizing transposase RayT
MEQPYFSRRHPVHLPPIERHNQSVIVLVTVCTDKRRHLLARREAVDAILSAWCVAAGWQVGRYVMMPDHLHAFCTPAAFEAPPLAVWVKFWKSVATRYWPFPGESPLWQASFWDRQLRDSWHYGERWEYVRNNPVRAGLVKNAEDWPWQGEMNQFRFHDGG